MSQAPAFLENLPHTRAAWAYAGQMHFGQQRASDGAPFLAHPREVAELLYAAGCSDEVVAAGVLHDTVELTRADVSDINDRFGTHVGALVAAVTEDESIRSYGRRKAALRDQAISAGEDAAVLFAADKVSKAREFRAQLARVSSGGAPPRPRRLSHYIASLIELERVIPDHPLVTELRRELVPLTPKPALSVAS